MHPAFMAAGIAACLFVGVLAGLEIGYRWGARLRARGEGVYGGSVHIEGAIFALLGLLLAFNFAGAAGRLEKRHDQLLEEANAVGTAWLRLDLLPLEAQPEMRDLFHRYVDSRIAVFGNLYDLEAREAELARNSALQEAIWTRAVEASDALAGERTRALVLVPLNEMFDLAVTRTRTAQVHTSPVITAFVVFVALLSAAVAGYAMSENGRRPLAHAVVFALIVASTMYVIVDLDYPRFGLIRIDAADKVFHDLRASMGPAR